MKIWNIVKNHLDPIVAIVGVMLLAVFVVLLMHVTTGCITTEQRAEIREKIVQLIETDGQAAAIRYIDELVADGRLGAANAADIKTAIPEGIERVKEVLSE